MSSIDKVEIDLSVVLGATTMPIHQLLRMGRGAVIALDTEESQPVQILANKTPIALGQVLVEGERISVAITRTLAPLPE